MHSNVREMKTVARTLRKEREGILNWWKRGSTNSFLEGLNPVVQSVRSAAKGLQEHRLFQDDNLPPAGPPGLHGPEEADMRYPLETSKSPFLAFGGKYERLP